MPYTYRVLYKWILKDGKKLIVIPDLWEKGWVMLKTESGCMVRLAEREADDT